MLEADWRYVDGYGKDYIVTTCGEVFSQKEGSLKEMKGGLHTRGYRVVNLRRDNKCRTFYVHHLVAWAFLGPRPEGYEIDHKDHDRTNNRLENLEYVLPLENLSRRRGYGCRTMKTQDGKPS